MVEIVVIDARDIKAYIERSGFLEWKSEVHVSRIRKGVLGAWSKYGQVLTPKRIKRDFSIREVV